MSQRDPIKRRAYNNAYYKRCLSTKSAPLSEEQRKLRLERNRRRLEQYKKDHPNWCAERSRAFREKLKKDPVKWEARLAQNRERKRKSYQANKEKIKASNSRWRNSDAGRRSIAASRVAARKRNPIIALKMRVRSRVRSAIRGDRKKSYSSRVLLGCTYMELKLHLESLFKPGMSWENRGEWEIDHIRPCASFDLMDPEQQKCCFHFTNLQPLWRHENCEKGAKCL